MVKFIQHKLAILTVLKWETQWAISFGKFIIWCNHHYLPVLDHFPHLKKEPCSLSCHSPSSLPQPLKVKVAQSCLALCHPMDYTVHGILQARILEWAAFPSPGDLPDQEIKPRSLALQVDSLSAEPQGKPNTNLLSASTDLPILEFSHKWNRTIWGLPWTFGHTFNSLVKQR